MIKPFLPFLLLAVLSLSACGTSPRRSLAEVDSLVKERAGLESKLGAPAFDPAPILAAPLTADAAARLALARNAAFKTKLEEVGLAQADLAQAGILENPLVHGNLRLAGGSGPDGHQLGVMVNLLDLFEMPLRRRVASQRLEQAKSRLGHEVLGLASDAKGAFYDYVAANQRLELKRASVQSLAAAVGLAERQREAGNISELDLANESAARKEAEADLAHEEARTAAMRERLGMLLAIQDKPDWTAESALPDIPAADPSASQVESAAVAQRWDLQAARRDPQVLKDQTTVENARLFSPLSVGLDIEREYTGITKYGPEFELGVPLFDRRQAARARLRAQRRQSLASADALEAQVRYEARTVSVDLAAARKAVEAYKEAVPHRQRALKETLKNYNYMLLGVYHLLEAKRRELEASAAYVDALKDYWKTRAELERVAGGRLPNGGQ